MVVNLLEYKKNKQKEVERIITDEENYEIWIEVSMLQKAIRNKNILDNRLKLVK